ncbi:hypothetical protein [Ktedonospora formicarum]|uniref:Zinc-finger domain-containing protein n=1 Tax=Ktedonospora formicarum TaxID=2778364 RepID=A0A8J3MRJ6_9CHLR|nr:hypothetical protein [Ktedonospora formicarum]GHO42320.1 hypothetical protein KSX_04830 [Ktedonospora formicarum]
MNQDRLPPFPSNEALSPQTCQVARLYLAVWDDLTSEEKQTVMKHVRHCETCAQEMHLIQEAKRIVTGLEMSQPSARVDEAVYAAIANRSRTHPTHFAQRRQRREEQRTRARNKWRPITLVASLLLLCAASLAIYTSLLSPTQQFQIPTDLTWNGYVLHYSQTQTTKDGTKYREDTYRDLASDMTHVETTMDNEVDVVAVGNKEHGVLGKDMMNHVAQWDAFAWNESTSMLNLAQIRADLQAGRASYEGKETFKQQEVYQIDYHDGYILLLDMDYMPVNILHQKNQGQTEPVYDQFEVLRTEKVPQELWDMNVPQGFKMGTLPPKP